MATTENDPPENDSAADPHADKYDDPRVSITRRGVLIGIGVVLFGIAGSALSIYSRRTRLKQSRAYWGDETITALQLGERIQMLSRSGRKFKEVELTATPGLGHLRHALLDERNYDWDSQQSVGMSETCDGADAYCLELVLTDPTAHRFQPVRISLDLNEGWVGPSDGATRVKTKKRTALKNFLETLITVQQRRYDE